MNVGLYDHQKKALARMHNGCILCGGVGSGKSRTSLAYYDNIERPKDLFIITTARKRDTMEWDDEVLPFHIDNYVVDSWNNIKKYVDVANSFFIFDEQRVVGNGEWVKSFLKITSHNHWILLSATPGDTWMDYVPVMIANGYFKNKTQFCTDHVVYSRFTKYPSVQKYLGTQKLTRIRNEILVLMPFTRKTVQHNEKIFTEYNKETYKDILKTRWDYREEKPIETASQLCYELRRVCNSDLSRIDAIIDIYKRHPRLIIFYNFDYELELLKRYLSDLCPVTEYNGHKHEKIPLDSSSWIFLVQYNSGAEGWNCIETDCIVFYSQNYSYKTMIQAAGRIDRLNTTYTDLWYYHLRCQSSIDIAIARALKEKKAFNEKSFVGKGD